MHLLCTIRSESEPSRLEFLVRETSRARLVAAAELLVDAADRSRLDQLLDAMRRGAEPLGGGDLDWVRDGLGHLGRVLTDAFLPEEVRRAFASAALQGATLLIETNESRIPWELAAVDGVPLWRRFAVARREIVTARQGVNVPAYTRRMAGGSTDGLHVLIVADPQSRRPSAVVEARSIARLLERRGEGRVDLLLGEEATVANLMSRLESEPYRIIHIDAAAEFNPTNPPHSRIQLADENLTAMRLFEARLPVRPQLVFFHCPSRGYAPSRGLLTHASGWGRMWLELGAETVVTPVWSPPPRICAALTEAFYEAFGRGVGVGEAMRAARGRVDEREVHTVCGLFMHGNPGLAIERMGAVPAEATESRETEDWVPQARFLLCVTAGPAKGRTIPLLARTMLQGRRILIGSAGARANEIDLDDPELLNEEAYLEYDRGCYVLHSQSGGTHTRVNGFRLAGPTPLQAGDEVTLGASTLAFEEAAVPPSSSGGGRARARFSLQVLDADGAGAVSTHPLHERPVLLGRLAECAIRLDDPAVSRRHALVHPGEHGWYVRPSGSRSVLVNGVVVLTERRLEHGDEIQLSATTQLRFVDAEKEVF